MLRRIAETPNGGRLLCLDPQRLLADIGVEMTPECAQEARLSHPEFFGPTGREHAYDTTAACAPDGSVSVTVSGLFRGAST